MSEEDGAEKSHEASQNKLEEARKKGELVRSTDLHGAASYGGLLLCMLIAVPVFAPQLGQIGASLLEHAEFLSEKLLFDDTNGLHGDILGRVFFATAMFFLLPAVFVILSLVFQQSIVFAPSKLEPKLSKISILQNAKQKFGATGIFEFIKSFAKLLIISIVLFVFLNSRIDDLIGATASEPQQLVALMGKLITDFLILVVVISGAIAVIDYFWQRHSHMQKQMMTRQEVVEENKNSEGDPHMKGHRRQRAQEIAMNQMLADVPDAAVVVVNPTHYAVALKWSPLDPSPPICVAKGVDDIAARIREVAAEHGVPIHRDPPTARALHATIDIGAPIDREHFAAVAIAVRFAEEMRVKAKRKVIK